MHAPRAAPAVHSTRLSASKDRRSVPELAPSAARTVSSPSRRTVRDRIRLAALEQAMTKTRPAAARRTRRIVRVGSKLVAEQFGVDCVVALIRVGVRVVLLHRGVYRTQLGACLVESGARCQPTKSSVIRDGLDQ